MKPLVSIIILNYNGGRVTVNCLKSVLKTHYSPIEIILVDNGSDEKEIKHLKIKFGKKIRIITSLKNLGYAAGNNLGSEHAKGKYLVFLNNDTIVSPNWLEKPILRMSSDPKIAFLQPKIKWLKHKNYFEYAGGAGGYLDYFGYPFCRGRIFGSIEEDIGQYDDEREIFWASGVALFCRKNIFEKLKGFDPFFFAYAEENDLCFRAHRMGYRVIYFPQSVVYHLGGLTSNKIIFRKIFLIFRNHLVLLIKNVQFRQLLVIFPARLLMDATSIIYYLYFFRDYKSALAIPFAYLSLVINFPIVICSRYKYRLGNFGYPAKNGYLYRGSVVFQYFVLKKRRWSEIFQQPVITSKIIKIF